MNAPTPNIEEAKRLLALLDPSPDAIFCFMAIGPDGTKRPPIIQTWHGTLAQRWRQIELFNTDPYRRCGVFVTVHQIANGRARTEENVVRHRAVYAELDKGMPSQWPLEPSIIIESSPGKFHCWWLVELTYEEFRGVQRRMVADWNSDKGVIDAARVLRLPGTLHQKDPSRPHLVRVTGGNGKSYTRDEILKAFPPVPEPTPKPKKKSAPPPGVDDSQAPEAAWIGGTCGEWRARITPPLWEKIRTEGEDRSKHSYAVMCCLFEIGLHDDDMLACATAVDSRFAAKFVERGDIKKEIIRARRRWQETTLPFENIEDPHVTASTPGTGAAGIRRAKATNAEAADAFAREHTGTHKYNHTTGGWMTFNGVIWVQDRKGETIDRIAKFCARLGDGNTRFAQATEQLARNMPEFAVTTEMFDCDDWLLATPAGYIDLKTGEMTPPDPKRLVSRVTAVAPVKETPGRWMKFLGEITGVCVRDFDFDAAMELMGFLQRLFGYTLTGDTREQIFAFIYGVPGSGKTTLAQTIANVMGTYHKAGNVAALLTARNSDPNAPQPFLTPLVGSRMVTMAETTTSMVFNGPVIARLTGGEKVATRDMHGKAFEFSPKFKAVVYGNLPPKISGSASAIARRVLVIPLNCVFKGAVGSAGGSAPDLELMKKLEAEQGKILNWLIEGCLWWQKQGLRIPAIVAEASQKFVRDADIVATWKADRLVEDPAGKLFNGPAYEDYAPYARAQGREPGSAESFGHRLTELLGVETKPGKDDARKSVRFRAGWRLVSDRRTDPFTETAKPPTAPGTGPSPEIVH